MVVSVRLLLVPALAWAAALSFAVSPAAPTGLKATARSSTAIEVCWDSNVSGATAYHVLRKTGPYGAWAELATVAAPTTTYSDAGLSSGTMYVYSIYALVGPEKTDYSAVAYATTLCTVGFPPPFPEWMSGSEPWDGFSSGGRGPSQFNFTNLATGEFRHSPPFDITASNPTGADGIYHRTYRAGLAAANKSAPGLSRGWTDNLWARFDTGAPGAWNTVTYLHPDGAEEKFTPELKDGVPTGGFSHPPGVPYFLKGEPNAAAPGTWLSLTIQFKQFIQWRFEPSPNPSLLWAVRIGSANAGRPMTIIRDSAGRIMEMVSDGKLKLLTFTYDALGNLSSLVDNNKRKVVYTFGPAAGDICLLTVSQVVEAGTARPPIEWKYEYLSVGGAPFVSSTAAPDASRPDVPGALAAGRMEYDPATGRVRSMIDAEGNSKTYTYGDGQTKVHEVRPGKKGG